MKTMKKVLALVLVMALTAVAAVNLTLAYLQDQDEDVNVMTLGNVYIDQHEKKQDGSDFEDNVPLYPAIGDLTEENGFWTNENVVDKIVTVENTGDSSAYVRTIFAFEKASGMADLVHKNINETEWIWEKDVAEINIDGVTYTVWVATYPQALAVGATTPASLLQVALDKTAGNDYVNALGDTYKIPVVSQAIQTMGFADTNGNGTAADEALNEGFLPITATNHPWANGLIGDSWEGNVNEIEKEEDGAYHIYNGAQLAALNDVIEGLAIEEGIKVVLESDIDLGNEPWTPIGGEGKPFVGTFDGNGHIVSNVKVDGNYTNAGLFGEARYGGTTIQNLTVKNVTVSSNSERAGALVGQANNAVVDNCHVINANVFSGYTEDGNANAKVGGIVGDLASGTVKNSSIENANVTSNLTAAALAGRIRGDGIAPAVTNNTATDVTVVAPTNIGKFVGQIREGSESGNTANNVTLITGNAISTAEELAAWAANPTSGTIVITADIDMTGVAYSPMNTSGVDFVIDGNGHTISNLTTNGYRGGLIGKNNNADMTIKNLNLSNVKMTGDNADGEGAGGAIIGYYEDHANSTVAIENCTVVGMNASNFKYMGGLVGYTSNSGGTMTITDCSIKNATLNSTYAEAGTAKGHVGGLVGRVHVTNVTGCTAENVVITTARLDRAGAICGTITDSNVYSESNNTMDVTIAANVSSNDDLAAAISNGATTINLAAGTYDAFTLARCKNIDFVGAVDSEGNPATIIHADNNHSNYWPALTGTIKNVKFTVSNDFQATGIYKQFGALMLHDSNAGTPSNVNFENCDFIGMGVHFVGVANFYDCTFDGQGTGYSAFWYSCPNGDVTIESCTFDGYSFASIHLAEGFCENVVIRDCEINSGMVELGVPQNLLFEGNVINNTINMWGSNKCTFNGNTYGANAKIHCHTNGTASGNDAYADYIITG